jgi:hypothetical protein
MKAAKPAENRKKEIKRNRQSCEISPAAANNEAKGDKLMTHQMGNSMARVYETNGEIFIDPESRLRSV